ncbi:hypothetical protein HL666_29925 [Bradyrhizobium sp. 83002]|uniref:HNH endonuclease n=1 Tax=Bradyrhizobium aeschynomenes TaxID=2734909 RepID=UPI001554D5EB|nr:hypothetical protein [Bradyrhizobium aeschynomenes]NPU15000.1 hypothetical protein [Bradyrhizobium aeschynomenes]
MAKKAKIGKCVHCLRDGVELTSDHMFPQAWYPDATPENLEKWQFPCCFECNQRYSKIEDDLLNRFALVLDAKHPASQGLVDAALRAIDPNAGRNEKDAGARAARRRKLLADTLKGEAIPEDQVVHGLGERWGRGKSEQLAIQIPRAGLDAMTEKIVRGLAYREDGRFIEPPYTIQTFLDGTGADVAREMIKKAGQAYKREPGLEIIRATVDGDKYSALYEVTFWQQFKTYATIQTEGGSLSDVPHGYRVLNRNELVQTGDLWCHHGKVHRFWLPITRLGKQESYNDYCRLLSH